MRLAIMAVVVAFASCKSATTAQKSNITAPPVIVYKTKADYSKLVPVTLSEDKSKIVSYPDPSDLQNASGYTYPEQLHKGYLLDKRGIGKNSAFLKLSYEEYSSKPVMPLAEMQKLVIDTNSFTEMYQCDAEKFAEADKLNGVIDQNKLRKQCKKIK